MKKYISRSPNKQILLLKINARGYHIYLSSIQDVKIQCSNKTLQNGKKNKNKNRKTKRTYKQKNTTHGEATAL